MRAGGLVRLAFDLAEQRICGFALVVRINVRCAHRQRGVKMGSDHASDEVSLCQNDGLAAFTALAKVNLA